jgi:hypothetical protein
MIEGRTNDACFVNFLRKGSFMKLLVNGKPHLLWHLTMEYFMNRKLRSYWKWEMHGVL